MPSSSSNSNSGQNSSGAQERSAPCGTKNATLKPTTRRSFIGMFLLGGSSVRHIAKTHSGELPARGGEAVVEQHLREEMISGGAIERHYPKLKLHLMQQKDRRAS